MKLALNGATTMRANLVTDLHAAKAAGFDYLEIWAAKLRAFLKERSTTELKDLFAESGVAPLSINSIEHITFRDARAYESIKQECDELSRIAAAIGCPCIVVVPGRLPEGGASRETVIDESVRVLNELCDISGRHGVTLAFEFLGQTDCSVRCAGLTPNSARYFCTCSRCGEANRWNGSAMKSSQIPRQDRPHLSPLIKAERCWPTE